MSFGAFDLVNRIRGYSPAAANAMLARALPLIIPLAGGLRIRVREVTDTRAELTMPLLRRSRNHVGSMYFGAQMTLADLTAGVLIFSRWPPGPYGALIKRVEADFLAKAKATIRCVCALDTETAAALDAIRTSPDGKAEAWLPLELSDQDGRVVTRVRFLGALKRFGRARFGVRPGAEEVSP
jgi:acyl-coenzyme A thioesterase PaaI-like protein